MCPLAQQWLLPPSCLSIASPVFQAQLSSSLHTFSVPEGGRETYISCVPVWVAFTLPSSECHLSLLLTHSPVSFTPSNLAASEYIVGNKMSHIGSSKLTRSCYIYYLLLSLKLCVIGIISHILTTSPLGKAMSGVEVQKCLCNR